jgi:hypothetical protein
MPRDMQKELSAPFEDTDIEWRLQYADAEKGFGIAVPYITNRAIQNRLDKIVGINNWRNEYIPWHGDGKKSAQLCGISIYFSERGEWITKYDGAEDSEIESVKGGLSDSMKRAAVQWGIGRYLYSMDTVTVDVEKSGKSAVIKKSAYPKLDAAHQRVVQKLFPSEAPQEKPAPASGPRVLPPAETTPPAQPEPAPETPPQSPTEITYFIMDVTLQPSVRGMNTLLRLQSPDGKTIIAYMQGENPALVKGARIANAVITKQTKDGVVFYTLDSFTSVFPNAA